MYGYAAPNETTHGGGYKAAGNGRRLMPMRAASLGPNVVTLYSLGEIVARARNAARNDPWAGAAADKSVANGIGTGIQAKAQWGTKAWRAREQKLWKRWGKVCDADGVLNLDGLQALIWRECEEAGECFVRLRNRRLSDGLPVPLQLQVIEAEQCPPHFYGTASNGNQIRAGIEFDLIGRRVAYWMYPRHPGDFHAGTDIDATTLKRVPADEVIHVYEPVRAGQIRGIPRAASVLVRMFNLDALDDAVLERQKIANLFVGVFEDADKNGEPTDPMAESLTGDGTVGPVGMEDEGIALAGLEPATTIDLGGTGRKFNQTKPPDAGNNYPDYLRQGLLAIAARWGVPYEVLTGDLRNVSDRALRLILNEFRRFIEMRQWLVLIPRCLQPIREAYLDRAVLAGALAVPGYDELREDVAETLWVPQGWPYSHPVQDVDADIKAIRGGLDSRSATILRKGEDPEEVASQQQLDNADADARGLILDTDPRRVARTGSAQSKPAGNAGGEDTESDRS
ncbi:phage portal protein [Luteimonas sp. FCS-9]|uniref:phage portal protein n=1 Tax=Luteimonas sp. FCS-9 TaxID=1547516 RepID=UPI00063E8890|nr:phage portal protein [Luteimonas sp. FCS-9]KLJ02826.1 phage portal protein [Luteimonas sp. FCS-9]